jgi:hypothetical protein
MPDIQINTGDKLVKFCAVVGACGIMLTALSLFLNWQTTGINNASDIKGLTTSVNSIGTDFHQFAISADARLKIVEQTLAVEQVTITNLQASQNSLQNHINEIDQASRASLAPNRQHN